MTLNLFFVFPETNSDKQAYRNAGGIYINRPPRHDNLCDAACFLSFLPELIEGEENLVLYYSRSSLSHLFEWISSFDDEYPAVPQLLISDVCFAYMQSWEDCRKSPVDYSVCIDNGSLCDNIVSEAVYRILFCSDTKNALVDMYALDTANGILHFVDGYGNKTIRRLSPDKYILAHYLADERVNKREYEHNPKHPICPKRLSRNSHASSLSCCPKRAEVLLQFAFGTKKLLCAYNRSGKGFVAFRSHTQNHWHGYDISREELEEKGFSKELLHIIQRIAPY